MKILILAPYPPYPPHGGGTMRIYQIIRGLAARHRVTCLAFVPDATAATQLEPLRSHCRLLSVVGPPLRSSAQRALTTLSSRLPDMALRNAAPEYTAALQALLASEQFDVVQAESIEMAQYLRLVSDVVPQDNRRPMLVLDQFNAEFLLQKRAALTSLRSALKLKGAARSLAGGLYSLAQWVKLARYERWIMRHCDAVIAVSEDDLASLERLGAQTPIVVVPNGVDTDHFNRAALTQAHSGQVSFSRPTLVFSGTLDYRPNVDAVTWFAEEVLPLVRARQPNIEFLVVGKRPAPAICRLAEAHVLTLTGEVADARPFMAAAAAYVVPMRIGGGVRLKLLEALALTVPVVSTSMGAEGVLELHNEQHCLIADQPQAFADATVRLINDAMLAQRLGKAGRALVRSGYDWRTIIPRLEAVYQNHEGH